MFSKSKIIFILFLPFCLFCDYILEVPLATKEKLAPIYLMKLPGNREFNELIYFDLNHSGFSYVLSNDFDQLELGEFSYWRTKGVQFVVQPQLRDDVLSLQVANVNTSTLHQFSSLPLTGVHDRQKIHRLLSMMQKELFGVEGIFHKKILFSKRFKNPAKEGLEWISEIWMSDFDGKNEEQLTFEQGYCVSPQFVSKRSDHFIYVSYKHGQSKIFLGSLENKKGNNFIPLRGNQILPCLSPSCDRIAFICDAAGRPDLFLQNFDPKGALVGKPKQLFSYPRATQATPTFSPDGKQIAFVSDKDGPPRIYTIDINSSQAKLLTTRNRQNTSPNWSPDGTKIAYSAKTEGVRQIWICDLISKEEWQLTFMNQNLENPVWAPDSLHLIFNSENEDISELYLVDIYQKEPVKISEGPGQKRFPAWQL